MRVLLITGSFPPMRCGVGDYTSCLAQSLAMHSEVEVAVLTSRAAASQSVVGKVRIFPKVEIWGRRDLGSIRGVLKEWQPDIVHIQFPTQGYGGGALAWFLPQLCAVSGFRVVQTWHEHFRRIGLRSIAWALGQALVSGGVVAVHPRYEASIPPLLRGALHNKVHRFIPNAAAIPAVSLSPEEREALRRKYGRPEALLIVYFGFIYPAKGVELLFDIASAERHHLVIIGQNSGPEEYYRAVIERAHSPPWVGRATVTGFLREEAEVARVLAAADAVVLPFAAGGGEWNTSLHAAQRQGTFVVTTSAERNGYVAELNTYFACAGDVPGMRSALAKYVCRRRPPGGDGMSTEWDVISAAHLDLYRSLLTA